MIEPHLKSGIYQIKNLKNSKCYIGLSRDIFSRWRQHTFKVQQDDYPKSRIRAAFKKYGLNQTVSKPGVYCSFEFKIIEECHESLLFDREKYWIEKIKPEYNCNRETLPRYYRAHHPPSQKRVWLQYHNHEKEKGFPADDILKSGEKRRMWDSLHYISSRKRSILYTIGDTICLIVGIGNRSKHFFLWSTTLVEEVDFLKEEDLIYNAIGEQYFLNPPQLLNDQEGFKEFFKKCGNFGFGFQNISDFEFTETLKKLALKFRLRNESMYYWDYVRRFEKLFGLEA